MTRIITIHEYILRNHVTAEQFERAVETAKRRGLFDLPGLIEYRFLKYIRGSRNVQYAAVWIYRDRESWEKLWGRADHPVEKADYPDKWKIWEDELLEPLLAQEPDRICYAAYEELL